MVKQSAFKKTLLFLPALIGYITHAPLYVPVQKISWARAHHVDHYDSVLVGLLFILYPFYLLLISLMLLIFLGSAWWLLSFLVLPFFAWSFVQVKEQF